jgi:hypothetical protein
VVQFRPERIDLDHRVDTNERPDPTQFQRPDATCFHARTRSGFLMDAPAKVWAILCRRFPLFPRIPITSPSHSQGRVHSRHPLGLWISGRRRDRGHRGIQDLARRLIFYSRARAKQAAKKRISGVLKAQDPACLIPDPHIFLRLACCFGAFFRSLLRALPPPGMPGFTPDLICHPRAVEGSAVFSLSRSKPLGCPVLA